MTSRTPRCPRATHSRWPDGWATGSLTSTSPTAWGQHATSTWSPGAATQPCAELLENLATSGFDGTVVVEINTRRSEDHYERESDVAEALAFTRLHLAAAMPVAKKEA